MKILILGVGGVGGYFGARLVESGADVSFLVRPARKAAIAASGLRVESPFGNFRVEPRCLTREEIGPDYDLVLLAAKAYDLESALEAIAPAVGEQTCVVPFLNGWTHMARLDERFGAERVLGGVAHIAGELGADGVVRQHSRIHSLTVGGRGARTQDMAKRFVAVCAKAGFDSALAEDIEQVLWDKWVFLATLAGATTLMRASVGAIMATQHGETLIHRLYAECQGVASAVGRPVGQTATDRALGLLTERGSGFTASMLRDLEAGQATEHDHVLGALIAIGGPHGCDLPLLTAAHVQMQVRAGKTSR